MSTAEWGYLKQGDVVVDPQDGRHWQLVSEPEYGWSDPWAKEPTTVMWLIESIETGGQQTTVTMPLHQYVEKVEPGASQRVAVPWATPPIAEEPALRYGVDYTEGDKVPQLCDLCGQPMTVTEGIIHQTLGAGDQRVCVRRSDGQIVHPDPMPADLPDRINRELATAIERPLDAAVFEGNPVIVQDPAITAQQEAEHQAVVEAWQADGAEIIASETDEETAAREAATMDEPLLLPEVKRALELRSHLYLVHGMYVPELDPGGPSAAAALLEHHRKAHIDGPMKHPHIHQEA